MRVALATYPRLRPRVFFDESVKIFHPLINPKSNEMNLLIEWKEDKTWLIDVLMYVKKAFHLASMLDVDKNHAFNREALCLYKDDYAEFLRQCQLVAK